MPLFHHLPAPSREGGVLMNRHSKAPRAVLGLAVVTAAVTLTACSGSSPKTVPATPQAGTATTSGAADTIAFRRFTGATSSSSQILTARLDGSQEKVLTTPGPRGVDSLPTWSPDGSRLAFSRSLQRPDCGPTCFEKEIYVVGASGGTPTQLTQGPGGVLCTNQVPESCSGDPAWSPDGK